MHSGLGKDGVGGGDAHWGEDVPWGKGGPIEGIVLGKGCGMKRRRSWGKDVTPGRWAWDKMFLWEKVGPVKG